jgi:AcrR family transcriptional regulator
MVQRESNLRERRRIRTRRSIQEHAMRLFLEQGYDATTVSEVAAAAEVSAMTVYRHFPTKDDLVLTDEYDPLIAQRIRARPPDEPLMRRIGAALVEGIAETSDADRELLLARLRLVLETPALRSRLWDNQYASQAAIVEALRGDPPDPEWEFRLWICTGACLSAASTALTRWAAQEGRCDLGELMTRALAIVAQ